MTREQDKPVSRILRFLPEEYGRLYFLVSDEAKDLVISTSKHLPDLTRSVVKLLNMTWKHEGLDAAVVQVQGCSVAQGDIPDLIADFFKEYNINEHK